MDILTHSFGAQNCSVKSKKTLLLLIILTVKGPDQFRGVYIMLTHDRRERERDICRLDIHANS